MNWRKDSRKAFGYGGAVVHASDGTYCYKVTIGDGVAYGGGEIIQNTGASSGCESSTTRWAARVYAIGYYASASGDDQNYDDGDYCPPITGSRTALLSLVVDDSATEQTLVSDEPTTCYYTFELTASSTAQGDGSFTEDECDPHREDRVTCGCLAVTKKRKCNRRAKCAWVGGSHKCLADCEVLTKESRCRKKRNCVYKSGACRFKHACAYKISHGKCEKASKCRVKKFAGAEKFDAHGQKMWLCEHREKAN
ncbi:hypothetical protein SO694_00165032 [Aureococcus anophagefferens]|uniref:MRH domain-containing protein n=1 Tax=Aureococcus anophagefferens TaxID=44056 RepID=A0ABR1G6K6_AURAN